MPIVTAAKCRCQFPRRRDISVAVQNVADLVRVFLMDALQRQFCEPLGSRSVKFFGGRLCDAVFLIGSAAASRPAQYQHCEQGADEILKTRRKKSERHGDENHPSVSRRKS